MKHKKDASNIKSVNKPMKSPALSDNTKTVIKEQQKSTSSEDCHQDIVKRLMTHSQYFPSNPNSKQVPVTYCNPPSYHSTHYALQPQYQAYSHQLPIYENSQPFTDYYSRESLYHPHQNSQAYNQFANINTCPSPSLSSPSTHNNFDQISNGSPRSSNYVFNGDFTFNFNADFDGSFPLIDGAKTEQLFDNQAMVEIKSFEAVSNIGQLTPVTIESQLTNDEIKNSFKDVKASIAPANLSDDDVLSIVSCTSIPSPSATVDWKFSDLHWWRASVRNT